MNESNHILSCSVVIKKNEVGLTVLKDTHFILSQKVSNDTYCMMSFYMDAIKYMVYIMGIEKSLEWPTPPS